MRKTIVRQVMCVGLAIALVPEARSQTDEDPANPERAVFSVVEQVFDAMRTRDTVRLRSLFDPGVRLTSVRRVDGKLVVQATPIDKFIAAVGASKEQWLERSWGPRLRMDGPLATVWTEYDFHLGGNFSHCGVDAFQLHRTTQGWKIFALADTYRTEGCPKRPPVSSDRSG